MRRAGIAAIHATQVRRGMAVVNNQVPNIRDPGERISKDKNRVSTVKHGIAQQQQRADQAQPPESRRHDHPLKFFGSVPLDDKAREEHSVAEPSHNFPDTPLNAQKLAVVPKHIC